MRRYRIRIVRNGTGFGFSHYADEFPDVEAIEAAYPHLEVCFIWDNEQQQYGLFLGH